MAASTTASSVPSNLHGMADAVPIAPAGHCEPPIESNPLLEPRPGALLAVEATAALESPEPARAVSRPVALPLTLTIPHSPFVSPAETPEDDPRRVRFQAVSPSVAVVSPRGPQSDVDPQSPSSLAAEMDGGGSEGEGVASSHQSWHSAQSHVTVRDGLGGESDDEPGGATPAEARPEEKAAGWGARVSPGTDPPMSPPQADRFQRRSAPEPGDPPLASTSAPSSFTTSPGPALSPTRAGHGFGGRGGQLGKGVGGSGGKGDGQGYRPSPLSTSASGGYLDELGRNLDEVELSGSSWSHGQTHPGGHRGFTSPLSHSQNRRGATYAEMEGPKLLSKLPHRTSDEIDQRVAGNRLLAAGPAASLAEDPLNMSLDSAFGHMTMEARIAAAMDAASPDGARSGGGGMSPHSGSPHGKRALTRGPSRLHMPRYKMEPLQHSNSLETASRDTSWGSGQLDGAGDDAVQGPGSAGEQLLGGLQQRPKIGHTPERMRLSMARRAQASDQSRAGTATPPAAAVGAPAVEGAAPAAAKLDPSSSVPPVSGSGFEAGSRLEDLAGVPQISEPVSKGPAVQKDPLDAADDAIDRKLRAAKQTQTGAVHFLALQ